MGSGRERNQPCWCGSGKKYKHCHQGREHQQPVSIWEARAETNKVFSTKTCLHPQAGGSTCSGPIVRAHTVRRSADLRVIARDGHVYHPEAEIGALVKTGGQIPVRLIGINEASTFWGFCAQHDSATFAPLETQPLVPTDEQAFLLAYRPLVKELYLKERRLEHLEIVRRADKGKPLRRQLQIQEYADITGLGIDSALRDLRLEKSRYDADLLTHDFSAIRFVAIHFAETPDVMCSGVVQPYFSFSGALLQDLADPGQVIHDIAFSIVATNNGGSAIFSWRSDGDQPCGAFVDSLLALPWSDMPAALVRFALSDFENVFFRPEWWESLPDSVVKSLTARLMDGTSVGHPTGHDYLVDDGVRPVRWSIQAIGQKRQ